MPTLGRSTPGSKLLARMHFDNGSFPFVAGDWATTAGTISVVAGRLRFTHTGYAQARYTPIADRSEVFVYGAQRDTGAAHWLIITVHHSGAGDGYNDSVASWLETRGGAGTRTNCYTINDGVGTLLATGTVSDRDGSTWRHGLYGNGTSIIQRDYDKDVTNTVTSTRSSGGVGIECNTENETEHYVACTERAVTVTGIPAGGSAEIRKADDTILDTDDQLDDGVATFNMQSSTIRLEECVKLVVKNSIGTIIATYDAGALGEIIEPGETYILTGMAGGSGAESWAHPSGARTPMAIPLTADDPIDLVESGHKE